MKQLAPCFLTSSTTLIYLSSYFVFTKVCLKQSCYKNIATCEIVALTASDEGIHKEGVGQSQP